MTVGRNALLPALTDATRFSFDKYIEHNRAVYDVWAYGRLLGVVYQDDDGWYGRSGGLVFGPCRTRREAAREVYQGV